MQLFCPGAHAPKTGSLSWHLVRSRQWYSTSVCVLLLANPMPSRCSKYAAVMELGPVFTSGEQFRRSQAEARGRGRASAKSVTSKAVAAKILFTRDDPRLAV